MDIQEGLRWLKAMLKRMIVPFLLLLLGGLVSESKGIYGVIIQPYTYFAQKLIEFQAADSFTKL
ncbi:hypothetical protein [Brevibacillus brevis]|uniref:ABC transporter permease n=1 Tax=Brevibacillus brevis TaxID=1393 RepID=A0ABY9T449_BREBE|nr:hypothetical protein [Brevibacillus brevis]WNC14659.1 hypothetical protein RGB73_29030 [Brevibacillus brevis]